MTPHYKIIVDGVEITPTIRQSLISLNITDNRGIEADQLDIQLDDSDGKLAIPERGAAVQVWLGWQGQQLVYKGKYNVDEVTHQGAPDTLTIVARSADFTNGLKTNIERSWNDVSISVIINTIASEADLTAQISGDIAIKVIDHIDQTNESNASFITRLAEQFDAIATVKDGKLLFCSRASGLSVSGKPLPAITITRQSGDAHSFNIADRQTYTGIKATYHDLRDAIKGEVVWNEAEDEKERKKQAVANYQPLKPTGPYQTLQGTYKTRAKALIAARKQWRAIVKTRNTQGYIGVKANYNDQQLKVTGTASYGKVEDDKRITNAKALASKDYAKLNPEQPAIQPTGDSLKVLRHVYSSKENATRAARNEWRKLQRGMAQFNITLAVGNPELMPEQPAIVSGFKPQIDNTNWIITRATHSLSDQGFITRLDLEIKATEVT